MSAMFSPTRFAFKVKAACFLTLLSRLAARPSPSVLIIQTHDGDLYEPFFSVTQPANRNYAKKHGYDYWSFVGVVRGQ